MYRNSKPFSIFIKRIFLFLLVVFICRLRTTALFFANDRAALRERQRCSSRTANRMSVYKQGIRIILFPKEKDKKKRGQPQDGLGCPR